MTLQLLIDGADKSSITRLNGVEISDDLNARNTLDFTLLDPAGEYRPQRGDHVALYDRGAVSVTVASVAWDKDADTYEQEASKDVPQSIATVAWDKDADTYEQEEVRLNPLAPMVFAGLVSDTDETVPLGTSMLETVVNCVDYNQLADRRLVAEIYEDMTAGDIVRAIVTKYLAADGVTANGVQEGPVIPRIVFNYVFASDAFDELCDRTGFAWNIDYSKDLKFFGRDTYTAPFTLSEASGNFRGMHVKRSLSDYRNRQYLRGGKALTAARIESWKGDGTNRTFTTAFPIGKVPALLTVGGVTKTLGIRGVDSERQWYWSKGADTINQDSAETAVPAGTVIELTYQGLYPIIVSAKDEAQIAERAAAEGTSGVYEAIAEDRDIDDYALALDRAMAYLRKKGLIQDVVTFQTDTPGLQAGQLIPISVAKHRLAGDYLIDSVSGSDVDGKFVRWKVRALSGERLGSWVDFFKKLAAARQSGVLGTEASAEMEVLNLVQALSDAVAVSDALTATPGTRDTRADTAMAGFCEAM